MARRWFTRRIRRAMSAACAVTLASEVFKACFGGGSAFLPSPGALPTHESPGRSQKEFPGAPNSKVPAMAALLVAATAATGRGRGKQPGVRVRGSQKEAVLATEEQASQANQDLSVSASAGGAASLPSSNSNDFSWERAFRRMWTKADTLHVHAISGAVHTLIGLAYLIDIIACDVVQLTGGQMSPHVPFDWVLVSMVFGAINAVSGLQPSLLPRPFADLPQLLGIGKDGNLQAAGFLNTAGFYFFLTYQSLRVLPAYPLWLQSWDPVFAAVTFVSIFHAIFIINSWVDRDKLSRGFALGMSLPLLLNVPVSLHLFFQGQSWVENLSAAYPGWPEVFFSANYALAWAGSMVTLVLSLYERKVCDLTQRLLLTLFLGLITFIVIPLRAKLLIPQWFEGDGWMVMLTLNPPSMS